MHQSNSWEDIYFHFIDSYSQGNFLQALQRIISNPDIAYDSLCSQESLFREIVHFADACVFKGYEYATITAAVLIADLSIQEPLKDKAAAFLDIIKYELGLLSNYEALCVHAHIAKVELSAPYKNPFAFLDSFYLPAMVQRQTVLDRFRQLMQRNPRWGAAVGGESAKQQQPWHIFAYPYKALCLDNIKAEEVPVIFMQPFENGDYASLLRPFLDTPIIYVFDTLTMLFHHLHHEAIFNALKAPESLIYVLDRYPNAQIEAQDLGAFKNKVLKPLILGERPAWLQVGPLFTDVLTKVLNLEREGFQHDTPLGNWLYGISKRLLVSDEARRLGRSGTLALVVQNDYQRWGDPHKGEPLQDVELGPLPKDEYGSMLRQYSSLRQISTRKHEKIRLAHVVPQIVDASNAPTKLLRTLIAHHDRERFDVTVLSTERMVLRPMEYPIASHSSVSSKDRGAQTIHEFNEMGVPTLIDGTVFTYEMTAFSLSSTLKQLEVDIVVFHGPDVINNICAALADVPKRVLFEHGTPPVYDCYDLVILSTEAGCEAYKRVSSQSKTNSCFLPFAVDVRAGWEAQPYSKASLGLPADSFVMTTISNHLEERVGGDLRKMIGEILRVSPKAYYAPIGQIKDEATFREVFTDYGVNDRVVLLGNKKNASQYARSMELYLNEFPKGSCLGMLDALAVGCPVVSMHDQFGLPDINYAEVFFGKECVLHSAKQEDYVQLACSLIADPAMYREWSEHAKRQYEKHHDVVGYVKAFEAIILGSLLGDPDSQNKVVL